MILLLMNFLANLFAIIITFPLSLPKPVFPLLRSPSVFGLLLLNSWNNIQIFPLNNASLIVMALLSLNVLNLSFFIFFTYIILKPYFSQTILFSLFSIPILHCSLFILSIYILSINY